MNLLGHPYIAYILFHPLTWYHIAGSYLPDIIPFINQTTLDLEFHESGETLYRYLKKNNPDAIGLALGMLSHGANFGADKYSQQLEKRYEGYREKMTNLVMAATPNLTRKQAELFRFHNFLWWGIDVFIWETQKEFIADMIRYLNEVDLDELTGIISNCFVKDKTHVRDILHNMFTPLKESRFESVDDLANLWKQAARGLPERDEVNIPATVIAFEYAADILKPNQKEILDEVIRNVGENLSHAGYLIR